MSLIADRVFTRIAMAIALSLALTNLSYGDQQAMKLEIIELQHATVQQIVPLLEPLLVPGGVVTGQNDQLIIKTTPANFQELQEVLRHIDRRPRNLRIFVSQDVEGNFNFRDDQLSARIRSDKVRARIGERTADAGASVSIGGSAGRETSGGIRYETTSTRTKQDDHNQHFVTTLEGSPAFIYTGRAVPNAYYSAQHGPYRSTVQEGIDYVQSESGFYVTPRLSGDRVTLDIAPQLEKQPHGEYGEIDTRYSHTQATGRLGEWIQLSGSRQSEANTNSRLIGRTRSDNEESYEVWVRVEIVD